MSKHTLHIVHDENNEHKDTAMWDFQKWINDRREAQGYERRDPEDPTWTSMIPWFILGIILGVFFAILVAPFLFFIGMIKIYTDTRG